MPADSAGHVAFEGVSFGGFQKFEGARESGEVIEDRQPGEEYADKDVTMLALGTNDVMWGALQTGRVAATILSPPGTLFARKAGMNFMVDLTDLKLEYQGSTIATRRSAIAVTASSTLGTSRLRSTLPKSHSSTQVTGGTSRCARAMCSAIRRRTPRSGSRRPSGPALGVRPPPEMRIPSPGLTPKTPGDCPRRAAVD